MSLHPLDYDALKKGDTLEREQLERIFNVRADDNPSSYAFAVLGLREQIEAHRDDLICRGHEGHGILIMHDREAEEYLRQRMYRLVQALERTSGKRVRIDRSEFDDAHRRASESLDQTFTAIALTSRRALIKGRRDAKLFGAPAEQLGSKSEV